MDLQELATRMVAEQEDIEYVDMVESQANKMERCGVYSSIADAINPRKNAVHVDFASGCCHLLKYLKSREPSAIAIGVECSVPIIERARVRMRESGIPCLVVSNISEADKLHLESHSDAIIVVQSDIRNMALLKQLLKNRMIDSSSLMFPTPTMSVCFEGNGWRADAASLMSSIKRITAEARERAYKFITERTKKNGIAVVADGKSFGFIDTHTWPQTGTVGALGRMIRTDMGEYAKYWELGKMGMSPGGISDKLNLVPIAENRDSKPIAHGFYFSAALRRNERRIKGA